MVLSVSGPLFALWVLGNCPQSPTDSAVSAPPVWALRSGEDGGWRAVGEVAPFLLGVCAGAHCSGGSPCRGPGVTGPCPLPPPLLQNDGRLRLSRQGVIFKNSKTGKVDNIQASELAEGVWRRVALGHGLKLLTKNGHVYKYDGFRESVSPPASLSLLVTLLSRPRACPVSSHTRCITAPTPVFLVASHVPGAASRLRALGSVF